MTAEQLRKSILQYAIEGKLVSQDSNDESASVLLRKIQNANQKQIDSKKNKNNNKPSLIYKSDDGIYYENINGQEKNISEEIPFELPDTWSWSRISNLYEIRNGFTPLKTNLAYWTNGDIPWFTVDDIRANGRIIYKTNKHITQLAVTDNRIVPKNSFLLCCTASIGEYAYTKIKLTTNQQFNALTLKTDYTGCILNEWLFYIGGYFKDVLHSLAGKTTFEFVSTKKVGNILIPIPPLEEQKKIIEKIEQLEPLINEYDQLEKKATKLDGEIKDKLKKSILQYAIEGKLVSQNPNEESAGVLLEHIKEEKKKQLGKKFIDSYIYKDDDGNYYENINGKNVNITDEVKNLGIKIPKNWALTRLGSIGDWGAGATPLRSNSDYYGGDVLWLKTGELNNSYVYDTNEKITAKALKECSLKINKVGNILIAMYGATIGKLAIVGKELTTNQACCGCTVFDGIYNLYLFRYLQAIKQKLIEQGSGGAQPNISREKIVNFLIPLPSFEEQKRIVDKIEQIFELLK